MAFEQLMADAQLKKDKKDSKKDKKDAAKKEDATLPHHTHKAGEATATSS